MTQKILQYVILRRDLLGSKKSSFSTGANVSQACHAATAAIHRFHSAETTQAFLQDTENMTVCVLGVESGEDLEKISSRLSAAGLPFHLWIEKPEMIPTALATAPLPKEKASPFFSDLKLLR